MFRRGICLVLALHVAATALPLPRLLPALSAAEPATAAACACCPAGNQPCGCCAASRSEMPTSCDQPGPSARPRMGRCCCDNNTLFSLTLEPLIADRQPAALDSMLLKAGDVPGTCDTHPSNTWPPDPPPPRPGT